MMRSVAALLHKGACGLLLACAWATPAAAHTLSVSHVDIVLGAPGQPASVEVDLALRDVALTLPLDANHDEAVTWGELTAIRAPLEQLVQSNLALETIRGPCTLQPRQLATRRYDDGAYAALTFAATCPSNGRLTIDYRLFFDRDPQHRAIVTVKQADGRFVTAIARADAPRFEIAASALGTFFDFLREGIHHILIGYDHLAFLISLLLPAALVRKTARWEPAPKFSTGFGHVLGIVTAFTLAHSLTLSLAALGWVTPASRWVEASIAASVLLAALNNVWPVITKRVWMVGFAFGLIHGFGFAGALSELGLPKSDRLLALVGFNLGVEIGQLTVVALLLPLITLCRRKRWYARWFMPLASLAIALLAASWLFARLRG